jgi:hypothetical protein
MTMMRAFRNSLVALAMASLIGSVPDCALAGGINAPAADFMTQTVSGTVTFGTKQYKVTATTIPLTFYSTCYFISNGMAAQFPEIKIAFAGYGVASGITGIAASDFTVSNYMPWVINNNETTNNILGPDMMGMMLVNNDVGVTSKVAGGADNVITYTPQNNGTDPRSVNFLQGYIQSGNIAPASTGTIDTKIHSDSPFYNASFAAGTGTTRRTGTVPLVTSPAMPGPPFMPAVSAWMLDIPYDRIRNGGVGSETVTFQTFIESNQNIDGTTYDVLYGGVQWGYTMTSALVPEPRSIILLSELVAVAAIGCLRQRRRIARRELIGNGTGRAL